MIKTSYVELLNKRTPEQIKHSAQIKERIVKSAMHNINVINQDSLLKTRIVKLVENERKKELFKKLLK